MNTQKGFVPILIILVGLIVIGGGVYVFDQKNDLGIFDKKNMEEEVVLKDISVTNNENIEPKPEVKDKVDIIKDKNIKNEEPVKEVNKTIELKSGTQTKIIGATSTTITLVGEDFQSTSTMSKEEEEYFAKNTIYGCGNKGCFENNFKSCITDNVSTNIGGFLGSTYYEIKGKTQNGCNLLFKYTEYPEPSWVNKEMICEVDNSLGFESATMDMFQLASSGKIKCTGPFYDILQPKDF